MNQKIKDKQEEIYNKIIELQHGNDEERNLAFECIGVLSNNSINNSLESKLNIVENLIKKN